MKYKVAIIGCGFFGCLSAIKIAELNSFTVDLFEKKKDILLGASGKNQMRAHYGYHYPRSNETVKEVQKSMKQFEDYFPKNVFEKTTNYYAIAKKKSKTNSKSYINFLKNNKLYFKEINETNLFEKKNIDKTFLVKEKIINIFKARNFLKEKIRKNKKINLKLKKKFDYKKSENYDFVIYATYDENNSNIQTYRKKIKKMKYELVEKILIKMPEIFKKKSIVVLDGYFVCVDPYLGTNLHLLSDVKNSKIEVQYNKSPNFKSHFKKYLNDYLIKQKRISNFSKFIENSKKYLPILSKVKYYGSFYVIRSIDKNKNDTRVTKITKINKKNLYYIF